MTSYLNNGYDFMNCFAKVEKFSPHSIIIPSFMSVESQMPGLDQGAILSPPYKRGSQNTLYILWLKALRYEPFLKHLRVTFCKNNTKSINLVKILASVRNWKILKLNSIGHVLLSYGPLKFTLKSAQKSKIRCEK